MVAEYYESDFDMIFHFKAVENLVAEHYARDFNISFHIKGGSKLGGRAEAHYERDLT